MSAANLHSSEPTVTKQTPNGVQTGFDLRKGASLLESLSQTWNENGRLDTTLLQAICALVIQFPERAGEGFSPMEVADAIGKLMGRSWTTGDGKEQVSDKVRRQWKLLEKLMEQKREGLFQQAADRGFSYLVWPEREEGGGTGKTTRYLLKQRLVSIEVDETVAAPLASAQTSSGDEIRYICEDLDDAGPIARYFSRGYKMNSWRRWIFLAVILIAAIEVTFLVIAISVSLASNAGVMAFINITFASAVCLWGTWKIIGPIVTLPDNRINLAPWWMQSERDDRLIEWRCPPKHSTKTIKAARYTSTCPLCNGKISVKNGGREFNGRLVGRCAEAPSEHVFSFDHVLRRGKLQR